MAIAVISITAIFTVAYVTSVAFNTCSGLGNCSRDLFSGPNEDVILRLGALEQGMTLHDKQYWRIMTSMWLHASFFAYLWDIASLLWSRKSLEEKLKSMLVAVVFAYPGIGGAVANLIFVRNGVYVGAAGSLSGLNGAMLVHAVVERHTKSPTTMHKWLAIGWPILNILCQVALGSWLPHMNTVCTLAGFFCGIFAAVAWLCHRRSVRITGAVIAIIPVLAGLIMIFSGRDIYDLTMGALTKQMQDFVPAPGPAFK